MKDVYRIDDQKIFYFPDRLGKWLNSGDWQTLKKIYPVYMEVSPAGGCNHRCIFCALDYLKYKTEFLNYRSYLSFVKIAAEKGVKSIMFGGEGEPLLHPEIRGMVVAAKKSGIDTAMTTNGVLMTPDFVRACFGRLSWIKISLDAGSAETHTRIHGCNPKDYDRIWENIEFAAEYKRKKNLKCMLGVQLILLDENRDEILKAAKKSKQAGVDYFVVKPYSRGLFSGKKIRVRYKDTKELEEQVNRLSGKGFLSVFRSSAFCVAESGQAGYSRCNSVPFFWAYLMTTGEIYVCSVFLGDKRFALGNINKERFDRIWEGEARRKQLEFMKRFDASNCRVNCRMDKVNRYLEKLKKPPLNHAFI